MRRLFSILAVFGLLAVASSASAYEIRLILKPGSADPASLQVGDQVTYEIYLDTQSADPSSILFLAFSPVFDRSVLGYSRASSLAEDYYPLYAPSPGKTTPATFLVPIRDPFLRWTGNNPPGRRIVNVDAAAPDVHRRVRPVSRGSEGAGVGGEVEGVELDEALVVDDGEGAIEDVAVEEQALFGVAARDVVVAAVDADDVVGADGALDDEGLRLVPGQGHGVPAAVSGVSSSGFCATWRKP